MKRWCVEYNGKGEVEEIYQSQQSFLGNLQSAIRPGPSHFYCDATDELGALARFMEAWEKHNA
jgi:hypothetical protein